MFPKKKPGLGVMVAEGKDAAPPPRYKSAPDKLELAPETPAPLPEPKAAPEIGDYGDKLLSDATAPLVALGLAEDEAKAVLAGVFDSMAKCLRGDSEPLAAPEPAGDDTGGGMAA